MPDDIFDQIRAEVSETPIVRRVGRVTEVARGTLLVTGLNTSASQGDQVAWANGDDQQRGEIIRLTGQGALVLPTGPTAGIAIGDPVIHIGPPRVAPHQGWLGRVVDPDGKPLDDRPLMSGLDVRRLDAPPPPAARRRPLGERLETGLAVFNTLLPIVRGQRLGLFSGSGIGKSTLLAKLATGIDADVVVVALVGERGRELREFTDRVMGNEGMRRTVVVAATSDQSPLVRRRCLPTAMAVAEHFRDQGLHVLLLADSITRFAEAHREVALASGESASLRGYPPSTAHMIMSLCERAGPGTTDVGDISAVFTVLVAGSDMDEPIADILRGVLDGHIILDRSIAERGRYPAIDLLRSVSRSLPEAADADENALIQMARRLLGAYDRSAIMIQSGLYVQGADPEIDEAIRVFPRLDAFLSESESDNTAASFERLKACLIQQAESAGGRKKADRKKRP
ncbi:MAG: FliI/YscN family ATPase [Pseudomonadota bacterium]